MIFSGRNAGLILTAAASLLPSIFAQTVTYQAEDATLTGVTVATASAGYSGTGYVESFDESTDQVTFTITSAETKLYDLGIIYMGPYGAKYTRVSLNGGAGSDVSLPETTAWTTVSAGQVLLNAGTNTISLQTNWGWYLIDALTVTPSTPRGAHQVTTALVNSNSTPATKALMSFLVKNYGTSYISGQQDTTSYAWVESNIGKSPAILGLDFIEYSPSRVERGSTSTAVEDAIAFNARGGIVTFCWHWNAPSGLIDVAGQEWWRGFYTDSVTFDVEAALADTSSADYALLIRDIDAIAVQIQRLADADIPILWRPLHEAEGGWFWWGAKGPEPCKQLYQIVYDRLTNYHGLNNLIWIWNSVAADWYPGDATVDILSYDSYPSTPGDHGPLSATYNALLSLGNDKKLIATTEVGTIPDPELLELYDADWSWFVTWNSFVEDATANSLDFLNRIYYSDYVLTLDEILGWRGTSASSTTTAAPVTTSATSTTRVSTTIVTSTTSSSATASSTGAVASKYQQCGGVNWTGPTACVTGTTCTAVSAPYYYQCL
ncbi:uncharacterized protein LAJ45_10651 [Morchella importuna]|uniref:uncharacterized protein n=1 Tax=Morchella importuna TaxID=1174673 RepID=UPI001E8EC91C|nr:uncharacterized protein LAJ45_10651 [Morchella importuna]KAH8145368.1 hypothetical protein LAJ45_10651 [Morchella importuna]